MNITAKYYTSIPFTQKQILSAQTRLKLVSTNPVNLYLNDQPLVYDALGSVLRSTHDGLQLTVYLEEKITIPEGHEVFLQPREFYGEPTDLRYIGSFNLVIAKLTPEIRFHEFITTGRLPTPQCTHYGALSEDVGTIAKMEGVVNWNFGKEGDKYVIHYDGRAYLYDEDLERLHVMMLTAAALNAKEKLCQSSL